MSCQRLITNTEKKNYNEKLLLTSLEVFIRIKVTKLMKQREK